MKHIIAILLATILVTSNAASNTNANLIDQIKKLGENSNFGQYFSGLVELKLQQGNSVQQIITLIKAIIDGLINEQATDDMENSKAQAEFAATISQLEQAVEDLNNEVQTNNRFIGDISQEIASLASIISSLTKQLSTLNTRVAALNEERNDENGEFERRQGATNKILNAVAIVKTRLIQLLENGQFLEKNHKQIISDIKKELGDKHPVALMVEITSKFDQALVIRVIKKLEEIEAKYQQSLSHDEELENQAQLNYQTASAQLDDIITRLSTENRKNEQSYKSKSNDLVLAQRRASELVVEQATTDQLLLFNRSSQEIQQANYQARHDSRATEIQLVQSAYDIVSQGASTLTLTSNK